jgi:hypothetical protein
MNDEKKQGSVNLNTEIEKMYFDGLAIDTNALQRGITRFNSAYPPELSQRTCPETERPNPVYVQALDLSIPADRLKPIVHELGLTMPDSNSPTSFGPIDIAFVTTAIETNAARVRSIDAEGDLSKILAFIQEASLHGATHIEAA